MRKVLASYIGKNPYFYYNASQKKILLFLVVVSDYFSPNTSLLKEACSIQHFYLQVLYQPKLLFLAYCTKNSPTVSFVVYGTERGKTVDFKVKEVTKVFWQPASMSSGVTMAASVLHDG